MLMMNHYTKFSQFETPQEIIVIFQKKNNNFLECQIIRFLMFLFNYYILKYFILNKITPQVNYIPGFSLVCSQYNLAYSIILTKQFCKSVKEERLKCLCFLELYYHTAKRNGLMNFQLANQQLSPLLNFLEILKCCYLQVLGN